jgi:hypothetical protein
MIELDVPCGAKLSLDATDVQVEATDLTGDGIKDLVIWKNGAVTHVFQTTTTSPYDTNIGIDETYRRSREIITLKAIWKDFTNLAAARDATAKLYFSINALGRYSKEIANADLMALFGSNIKQLGLTFLSENLAT